MSVNLCIITGKVAVIEFISIQRSLFLSLLSVSDRDQLIKRKICDLTRFNPFWPEDQFFCKCSFFSFKKEFVSIVKNLVHLLVL